MKISIGDTSSIYPRSTASVASAETKTNRTTSHHPSTGGMGDRVTRYIRVKCGPQHATKKEEAVRHNTLSGPPINIRPNAVKIYLLGSIPYVSPVQPRSAEPRRAAPSRRGGCINPARAGCTSGCVALSAPTTSRIRLSPPFLRRSAACLRLPAESASDMGRGN